jgi:hypothetical protein
MIDLTVIPLAGQNDLPMVWLRPPRSEELKSVEIIGFGSMAEKLWGVVVTLPLIFFSYLYYCWRGGEGAQIGAA